MTHLTSLIPNLRRKAVPRSSYWTCFLVAAAALQLSACGGDEASSAAPGASAPAPRASAPGASAPGASPGGAAVPTSTAGSPASRAAPAQTAPVGTASPLPEPAAQERCDNQANDTAEQLLECVTLAGVRTHQSQLMEIAKAHNGTRLAGSPGYEASLEYAKQVLTEAGYHVTVQAFEFPVSRVEASSLREPGQSAAASIPHLVLDYSGSADLKAKISRPVGATGCKAADFAGFARGSIALVRRGSCDLSDKVEAAVQAGAVGVVIQNPDDGPLAGSLTVSVPLDLPVVLVSQSVGEQLAQRTLTGGKLRLQTKTSRSMATTHNLLAESTSGDADHVTMVGAHLDSVRAGAGINDNGSGTSAVLEVARQMARVKPLNRLRFALWGAEEQGLLGSTYYVRNLAAAERARIGLYLNFDMIASPNHVFFVYGGDGSAGQQAISSPVASARIVDQFTQFYSQRKQAFKRMNSGGRSDHKPFADIGIPFGGVFTGAEEIKSQEEAQTWGGTAGKAFDACYHSACDNLANFNATALDINADAVANAVLFYAMNRLER